LVSWAEHVASGKRTEVNGLEIFYIDRGSGDVVVLVHGWASSSFSWRRNIPHLSQRFRVIAPDLPGFGLSQRLPGGLELEHLRKVLLGLLDQIGVREFNVVGHSMGGVISAYIAAMTPERVRKLVLVNPSLFVGKGDRRPLAMELARRRPIGDLLVRFMVRKSVVRSVLEKVYVRKEALDDETVDGYYESVRSSGKTLIEAFRIIEGFDQGLLRRLRCPVLFVLGRHDVLVPPERNLELAREIGAEVFLDETSGHNAHEENPEEVSRVIAEFLSR
jgi:pimeloyl-ACP methyl ester carboxylesterase